MTEVLTKVYEQLGIIGVLLIFITFLWKDNLSLRREKDKVQEKRVEEAQVMNEKQAERAVETNKVITEVGGVLKDINGSIESLEKIVDRKGTS